MAVARLSDGRPAPLAAGLTRRAALAAALSASVMRPSLAADLSGVTLRVGTFKAGSPLIEQAAGVPPPPFRLVCSEFASGNLIVEAINAGSLDLGSMSEIPPIFGLLAGASLRLVALLKGDVNNQVVLVPPGSEARSIADLRGKRVGYVRATTSHYFLLRMLQRVGLSFSDIDAVNLSPADGRVAFAAGRLDAWAVYGFVVPLSLRDAGARVLLTADGYLSGNYVFAAHPAAIADPLRHAAIADYLGRLDAAYAWAASNHAAWAAAQAQALGLPENLVRAQLDGASQPTRIAPVTDEAVASQQAVADAFAEAGVLPRRVDVTPLWDRSFNAARAEAG